MSEPPPSPSPPLDYRSPEMLQGVKCSPVPALIASLFVYGFVAILMCAVLPKVVKVFLDFKASLPAVTVLTLRFGRWFREIGWLLLLPIPIALPIALSQIARRDPISRRNRTWRLMTITIASLLVIGFFFTLVVLMPLVSLIQSVSSPKK